MQIEKKLKILYLITKSNFGGAQRYVYDLATHMQKEGHTVLVAFGGNGTLATKLSEAGVRTVSIPGLERDVNFMGDLKTFLRLIDLFADEFPDIIHLNSSKMGALGALAARVWNVWSWCTRFIMKGNKPAKIIFTGHGWAFNEERTDFQRFLIGSAHWLTIQLSHRTIAVSRKTRDQVATLPFIWHKLVIIHNGTTEAKLKPRDEALDIIAGSHRTALLEHNPLIVGTIAELHKNKGLSFAIEGMAMLKKQSPTTPVVFVIIGEGEERAHLETLVAKLDLGQTVFFAGLKDDAATLLSAFDVFLLPSITEAFPYVILEAGNAGLPVVATAVGGIPEVVDDMQSGILIQSKNPAEVARAMAYLIEHPDRRKAFGVAMRERVQGKFNVSEMVSETLELYRSLLVRS